MSHTAHKTAERSEKKSRDESRADFKRRAWNNMPINVMKPKPDHGVSWWIAACAPDQRSAFIALAQERNRSLWSSVVPHAMNPQGEFR